jgi:ribose transport system ATP-binding protein
MQDTPRFLALSGVTKRYGGTVALEDVDVSAAKGTIHAVLGENGAGKSTLMKILAGVVRPDSGDIRLEGRDLRLDGPRSALDQGIVCVFQELSIVPALTVAENIGLADPRRRRFGRIDRKQERRLARDALAAIGCGSDLDLDVPCGRLPLPKRQVVEIAKALVRDPRVLILDEATSALDAGDAASVMAALQRCRERGVCVLFISHRMHEVDALADTCSVFRNGRHVETFPAGTRSHEAIVRLMIGRPLAQVYPAKPPAPAAEHAPYLSVADLRWKSALQGVSFDVRPGEIVGIGGLDGQGQRELLLALAGVLRDLSGTVTVGGRKGVPDGPSGCLSAERAVALIPEERKTEGLFLGLAVDANLSFVALPRLACAGLIDRAAEAGLVASLKERLQIKAPAGDAAVATLSGGNQQKVVLAKWLATKPRLLLLMDPTRGIDVGTKQEIYRLFRALADEGVAILFHSTDYDELIGLCDRVLVMYGGRIAAALAGAALTETAILSAAMQIRTAPAEADPLDSRAEAFA